MLSYEGQFQKWTLLRCSGLTSARTLAETNNAIYSSDIYGDNRRFSLYADEIDATVYTQLDYTTQFTGTGQNKGTYTYMLNNLIV